MKKYKESIIDGVVQINILLIMVGTILTCIVLVPVTYIMYVLFGSNTNLNFCERLRSIFTKQI